VELLEDNMKESIVKPVKKLPPSSVKHDIEHPGLGEDGKYHVRGSGNPLPEGEILTYALVGNQNCGKTTLFNQLTGANQHVGNFPGVTVDRKDGVIRGHDNTLITDLPGIYSMSPYSSEELVSRDFVLKEKPKAIINIVDATNIERNLYLTMQLLEMKLPMVVALNMMDELRGNGGSVDINRMEKMLGVPVVPISAAKNEGIDELVAHAMHIAHYQECPVVDDFCDEKDNGGAVHRCIHAVIHLIEDHAIRAGIPVRFAATKVIENDERIISDIELYLGKKIDIDGTLGSMTIKAINKLDTEGKSQELNKKLIELRLEFENKLKDHKKFPGRRKRFERLLKE
jgi:ferrous iron transport protein B